MGRKINIEEIREFFRNRGMVLLESKFVNAKTKMKFTCPTHSLEGQVKWSDFKQGKGGCKECNPKNGGKPLSYEYVKNEIESEGHILVSSTYKNRNSSIIINCLLHGFFETTYASFHSRKGNGCKECALDKASKRLSTPFDLLKKEFYEHGFILCEEERVIGWNELVKCICLKHPEGYCYISRSNIKKSGCKKCSSENKSGSNNPLWKGGITPENKKQRQTLEYKEWRKLVFERDNYTCRCCEVKGGKLAAHHINNFSTHKDRRTDVTNGITLCSLCHDIGALGSFHHVYGTYSNDAFQLQEYLDNTREGFGLPNVRLEDILHEENKLYSCVVSSPQN